MEPPAALLSLADADGPIGVAISGGSDSTALLMLAIAALGPARLRAATVDHQLRPAAADEAKSVARLCARHGVAHEILHWQAPDLSGNLQSKARDARYALLADWARAQGCATVLLGHTQDDQAETVLMQMARSAGLSGLSAMNGRVVRHGVTFVRPLLDTPRDALRDWLRDLGICWSDDPTNADARYTRVRTRAALKHLAPLGLDAAALSSMAARLRRTDDGVRQLLADWAQAHTRVVAGDIVLDAAALSRLHPDMARRVLGAAITFVTGAPYPPRGRDTLRLLGGLSHPQTLQGCILYPLGDTICIGREPSHAARSEPIPPGQVWDGRWRLDRPLPDGAHVAACGPEGLAQHPDWRALGHPRLRLLSAPAIWRESRLIALPIDPKDTSWTATFCRDDFPHWLLSH
ncbi:tRNA lysidine(34) synthetase TilS [Maribius pontilimi]|uniref:tRNA(Ile)-lysidine synthase n=1 Tax=Palleronia pontilimi TaxID=1964209 RepID=A0A934I6V0_9RHOB|nr:tRNA lysidine(34) synthetase TilS [Palleronia pontilimi]MBJ3761273.1 tRNA lysidine(34) synthetase TilS [Palleronia pontilimi]